MTRALRRDPIYRHRRFSSEIIETCVRWYITYRLSYRDLVAMMAERGVDRVPHDDHALGFALRAGVREALGIDTRGLCIPPGGSMRPPFPCEAGGTTCIGQSTSTANRSTHCCARIAAWTPHRPSFGRPRPRICRLAAQDQSRRQCREPSGAAAAGRGGFEVASRGHAHRRYLNNIVEQDHRAIKRRCAAMLGLKSFSTAAITLAGVELAHRIRKRQFSFGRGRQRRAWSLKRLWDRALASSCTIAPGIGGHRLCAAANAPELRC